MRHGLSRVPFRAVAAAAPGAEAQEEQPPRHVCADEGEGASREHRAQQHVDDVAADGRDKLLGLKIGDVLLDHLPASGSSVVVSRNQSRSGSQSRKRAA